MHCPHPVLRPLLTHRHARLLPMSQPYRRRSPETWTAARDAWRGGLTAEEVCARFDLGSSAFHKRARA